MTVQSAPSRHGEAFRIAPHIDGRGFTIACACGARADLTMFDAAGLARFFADHGQPPMPHPAVYRDVARPGPAVVARRPLAQLPRRPPGVSPDAAPAPRKDV